MKQPHMKQCSIKQDKRQEEGRKRWLYFHTVAAFVRVALGDILPRGNLWLPTAKHMKCADVNNEACTHTCWGGGNGKIPRPCREDPSWRLEPTEKRFRSRAEEERYPLLAAEIKWEALRFLPTLPDRVLLSAVPQLHTARGKKNTIPGKKETMWEAKSPAWLPLKLHQRHTSHSSLGFLPQYLPGAMWPVY